MSQALVGLGRFLIAALVCLIPVTAAAAPAPEPLSSRSPSTIAGYIIVQFRAAASAAARATILSHYPPLRETAGLYRLRVPAGEESSVAEALRADPAIELAAPDETLALPPRVLNWRALAGSGSPAPQGSRLDDDRPLQGAAPKTLGLPSASQVAAAPGAPPAAPVQTTPTPSPGPAIRRLWLSDNQYGLSPRGRAEEAGKCGVRFNATSRIWANLEYFNLLPQSVQVAVYDLGFLNRIEAVVGAGWGTSSLSGSGVASQAFNLNNLKVGCYEARAVAGSGTALPAPVRFEIVTAPLQDSFFPNDLWHLDHTRAYDGNAVADVKATGAWNVTTGDNTIIALISSGVKTDHPEFAGRIVPGWNTFDNTSNVDDDYGYGTFLAGFIGAAARNDVVNGVACGDPCNDVGVNWGARIMPLKVMRMQNTPQGYLPTNPTLSMILEAITYAYNSGAKVILVSFPIDPNTTTPITQQALRNVIFTAFTRHGALVVAPVGDNYYIPYPADTRFFPAALPGDLVLGVTATDQYDRHWANASAGDYVDLAAPGWEYLYGTNIPGSPWYPDNVTDPAATQGDTAVAAAQVAGIAGLIWSVNPTLGPGEVQQILQDTADKVDSETHSYDANGRNNWLGYGRVNAEAALWSTRHNMTDAFRVVYELGRSDIRRTSPGRSCIRIENTRTGAITWRARPSSADSDWVSVNGPYSALTTIRNTDYQGDLPSWIEACVNLGPDRGQRTYGAYTPKILAESLMPDPATPSVEIPFSVWYVRDLYYTFLPLLTDTYQWGGTRP
ncbi:MAG: S8 family serine peptidase [Anaerolineae bacterium]|nr:S8 family serine peptidase [Anaerolineae bacterium]